MMKRSIVVVGALPSVALALLFWLVGCSERQAPVQLTATNLLAESKGKVLVILMGMEGCSGTRQGTEELAAYATKRPAGVSLVRVDVPPPGEELAPASEWKQPYLYIPDEKREVADRLEFFFYPTLYILDRDGAVRYSGGLKLDSLRHMVGEIMAEQPGAPKKNFTPPLPAVGSAGADFQARTLDGKDGSLTALRGTKGTFLYFSSATCPFSVEGLAELAQLSTSFGEKGVGFAVINRNEPIESVKDACEKNVPGLPVIVDSTGSICKAYGVEPVPFYFVLDAKGAIAERKPFTNDSALAALNRLLGMTAKASTSCGAG